MIKISYIYEWIILFIAIFISKSFGLIYENHIISILGWILFSLGMCVHWLSHKAHPKAHKDMKEIDYIAKGGIYSYIRHPGYLGLMLAYFGLSIAFCSILGLIAALVLSIYLYYLALKEEKLMLKKFGRKYEEYMKKVPDRFIPIRKILRKV